MQSKVNPFFDAVAAGDLGLMEQFFTQECLSVQPYADTGGISALMLSAGKAQMQACLWLVEHGASVFSYDINEKTALHHACMGGSAEIVSWLLDKGCPIESVCNDNHTPLIDACRKGHTQAATVLIDRGANLETQLAFGYTPFLRAAWEGQFDTAQALVDRGANIHAINNRREGILHILAGEIGHVGAFAKIDKEINASELISASLALARRVMKMGVCTKTVDARGKTPIDCAASSGSIEMVDLLAHHCGVEWASDQSHPLAEVAAQKGHAALLSWITNQGSRPVFAQEKLDRGHYKPEIVAIVESLQLQEHTVKPPATYRPRRV